MMRSFFFVLAIILSGCQGDPPSDNVPSVAPLISPSTEHLLLIYEIRETTGNPSRLSNTQTQLLETQLRKRLDPDGRIGIDARVREMTTLDILLPADFPLTQQKRLRDLLSQPGFLGFRVLANRKSHQSLLKEISETTNPETPTIARTLADGSQQAIGKWVQIARGPLTPSGHRSYKYVPRNDVVRDAKTGKLLSLDEFQPETDQAGLELARYLESQKVTDIQVLVVTGDGCDLTGDMISSVTSLTSDGQSTFDIHFTPAGTAELTKLTAQHKPNLERTQFCTMAIILDDQILTAPRIMEELRTDRALITGHFSEAEVEEIATILRSGSLPKGLLLKFRRRQLVPASPP